VTRFAGADGFESQVEMRSDQQRYISGELTHFVGRDKANDDERYDLFLRILRDGELKAPTRGGVGIRGGLPASTNEMLDASAVCFCDIPPTDLAIHMSKYSSFGIAFPKKLLVGRGANPVFYVEKHSTTGQTNDASLGQQTRGEWFDEALPEFSRAANADPREIPFELAYFVALNFLGFIKFFDSSLADDDAGNFYMEREWRIIGSMPFALADVRTVILPSRFAARFREAHPGYSGQLVFAD
jgi:hypothetical protein